MKNIYFIFLLLLVVFSSSAAEWKPGEWLLSKPVLLSFTDNEKKQFDKCKTAKEEAEVFKKFHQRIFNNIPDKFIAKPGNKIITTFGTTQWEKVESVGECPMFPNEFPEYSLVFAVKYWISPEKQEAEFKFGIDDATEIRHNGKKIYKPLHGGAYKADKFVVPVTLKNGTNEFVFSAINYIGPGMLGARLYPKKLPINPGLFLETKSPVEMKGIIEINFYWMPSSIIKPRKKVYKNYQKCKKLEISDLAGSVVTQFSGKNLDFPIKINMAGKEKGVYKINSEYLDKKHSRYFFFGKNLTPTDKWKCEILKHNDFCSPDALWNQIFVKNKTGAKRIHAYKSKYDDTIQPYIIMLPERVKVKEGLPLIVVLRPYILTDKIEFIRKQRERRFNTLNAIMLWTHSRGCNGFKGLSEKDVLEVIDLVCEEYKIDRNRIFLRGDSLGAYGCWKIAGRYPGLFAGIQAFDGCELKYPDNLINVPIWQLRVKPHPPGYSLLNTIAHLNEIGAEAKFTDLRALKGDLRENYLNAKKNEKWFLNKKRNMQPNKVSYSTYGDIDGAYWVRNIMPKWFGRMAAVEAEVKVFSNRYSVIGKEKIPPAPFNKGGVIHVRTKNVSSFSLDLRSFMFLKFKNWEIFIDGLIVTNGLRGKIFSYEFKSRSRSFAQRKKNSFCGGIADVVYDSFLFAYSANDLKARMRAEKFNIAVTGIKANQFDGNFKVVPATELTPELCKKYNIILFATSEKPGKFLKENIEKLPFGIEKGKLNFSHAEAVNSNNNFACVYPNPIASNRYLLTVTMTNFTPRILMRESNDIIFGGKRGSFDINWDKIQWQDEFQSHEHKHNEHNCSEYGNQHNKHPGNHSLEKEIFSKSKRNLWKKYGLIVCFFGVAAFYAYDYFKNHEKQKNH